MSPMLKIAIKAAYKSGTAIEQYKHGLAKLNVRSKSDHDFVSDIDIISETIILETLLARYPHHTYICEESGEHVNSNSDYQWIIDPLDGTTNYLNGIPHYAVSIALKYQGEIEHAVVYDPSKDELFTASKGKGFKINGQEETTSYNNPIKKGVAVTGITNHSDLNIQEYLHSLNNILKTTLIADIRQAGSASLDLAYVACGRYSAFWQLGLKQWDIAAGILLVNEAGGKVSDTKGGDKFMETGDILASNPQIHKEILRLIQQ